MLNLFVNYIYYFLLLFRINMSLFERSQKLRPIPAAKEENQTGG